MLPRSILGLAFAGGILAPPVLAQVPLHRVNCGGGAVTAGGASFSADLPLAGANSSGYVEGAGVTVLNGAEGQYVGGWQNPWQKLHADGREGFAAYRFLVHFPQVIVRLHLGEIVVHGPQLRVFGLAVEGVPVLEQLDLAAAQGIQYGSVISLLVSVTDGVVDIEPIPGGDPALLNAIEIWGLPAGFPPPAAVSGLTALGGHRRNVLTWNHDANPRVQGYVVSRAESAGGPFVPIGTTWAAPPRFLDEDLVPGQPAWYRVACLDLLDQLGPSSGPVSATPLDPALSPLRLYELEIAPEQLMVLDEKLFTDPKLEVPALFRFEGQEQAVEVRYRGNTARTYSKKSWKIKFPASAPFEGQLDLNLKAHFADGSLVREPLTLDLLRSVGHAAAEHEPVQLIVNGRVRGVFDAIEQIEREYLKARDRDPGGSIYECNSNFDLPVDPLLFPDYYAEHYEKKTNEGTGHGDLIEWLQFLNAPPTPGFARELAARFDVDDYLGYLAVITLLADGDSVRHNSFLLHDLELERWELIAWDNEATWGIDPALALLPIDFGVAPQIPFNRLKTRVLGVPEFRWRFCAKLAELLARSEALSDEVSAAHAEVFADGVADIAKIGWESPVSLTQAPAALQAFLDVRVPFLLAALPAYQPVAPPTQVWINEFMADNDGGLLDEQGEAADWLELYNAGAQPVDVSGWWLTDDLDEPLGWALPAGTSIAPGGHLLIWADGETGEGPLHASFSLSKSGEELGLFAADGETLLDVRHFRPQQPGLSEGRIPDGGAFFRTLAEPTPDAANVGRGNLPPLITWVEQTPVIVGASDPVTVGCKIQDSDGLLDATLLVQVNGGAALPVAMTPQGPYRWVATIPAQPVGTEVSYVVQAVDGLGLLGEDPAQGYTVSGAVDSPLRVSELLASNSAGLTDEAGDHEDWVELHNAGSQPADLGGLHLTDNYSQPTKWTIPAGTLLPPGEQLLIWADDEPGEGPLHAAFKLGASGEQVGLFSAGGGTLLHGLSFGPQQADVSFGALPDGSSLPVELFAPTPGAANVPAPGGHAAFDLGNSAANGISLAAQGAAVGGQSFSYALSGAPPNQPCALLIGLFRLEAPVGVSGTLLLDPLLLLFLSTDGAGTLNLPLLLPADPVLDGVLIFCQPLVKPGGLGNAVASRLDSV